MLKAENIYDCPISEQIGALQTLMAEEHEKMIFKAVQQIGIEIDHESLIQAINNDRKRYEAAYNKGYSDCEQHYKELIGDIVKRLTPFTADDEENKI